MALSPISIFQKIAGLFRKKPAPGQKGAAAPFEADDNVVLVFGHSNAGKTVYFSVLYELLKGDDKFKLSPLNSETAASLIENYNMMRGKLLKIREGRQIEIEGERRFPTMTSETRILKFGLDLQVRKGVKFYTVDYKGETLSLTEPGALRKKFAEFFPYARAALFFIDASVLDTDVLLREQIAAFQTIIHDLRDCVKKKVPIGIVITKADFLEGFSSSNPVDLIAGTANIHKGRKAERFVRSVTRVNRQRFGEVWAKTTERVSRTLGNLIDSMVAYNLDFQFFFISATGSIAKKGTGDVEPPREIRPVGVAEPLQWAFKRILFNKRKWFWAKAVKWAVVLCLLWIVFFSIVNLYHYSKLYGLLERADGKFKENITLTQGPIAANAAKNVEDAYREYLKRIPVSDFFAAGELIDYAERQIRAIDDARQRAGIAPEVTPQAAGWDSVTIAAKNDYNKLIEELGKLPPDQQGAMFEQMLTAFFEKHPKEGLDPEFVKMVEANAEAFKKAGTDFPDKEFQITLGVSNLRDNTQISIQIGDLPRVDFTKYAAKPGIPDKQVTGKGNAPVTFTYRDFSKPDAAPLTEPINDPLKDFYPKLKAEGYKVNFGKEYGIVVKLKSGLPPQPPSLPRM